METIPCRRRSGDLLAFDHMKLLNKLIAVGFAVAVLADRKSVV